MSPSPEKAEARRGEAVDLVVRRIREAILRGRLAQGQRLIARELTAGLGFGGGTVREALGQLASEGPVELIPNRGAIVRRLSLRTIRDPFQIRELLEGLSARLAAQAARAPADRARVRAMRRTVRIDVGSQAEFHQQNMRIHGLRLEPAGNEQLEQLAAKMHVPFVMAQVREVMGRQQIERSQREHLEILRAVEEGDPDAAESATRAHPRNTGRWVDEVVPAPGWTGAEPQAAPAPARAHARDRLRT